MELGCHSSFRQNAKSNCIACKGFTTPIRTRARLSPARSFFRLSWPLQTAGASTPCRIHVGCHLRHRLQTSRQHLALDPLVRPQQPKVPSPAGRLRSQLRSTPSISFCQVLAPVDSLCKGTRGLVGSPKDQDLVWKIRQAILTMSQSMVVQCWLHRCEQMLISRPTAERSLKCSITLSLNSFDASIAGHPHPTEKEHEINKSTTCTTHIQVESLPSVSPKLPDAQGGAISDGNRPILVPDLPELRNPLLLFGRTASAPGPAQEAGCLQWASRALEFRNAVEAADIRLSATQTLSRASMCEVLVDAVIRSW